MNMSHRSELRNGVSVVELCVVLAILAVFLGIFIPATQRVREAARETVCKNNIRQLNLALTGYVEVADLPPRNPADLIGGWAIKILPLIEQQNLSNAINEGSPIADLDPEQFKRPRIMQCPTQNGIRPAAKGSIESAHYVLNGGSLRDAPLAMELPWATSPDLSQVDLFVNDGPHAGGYYSTGIHQHAVYFVEGDR